MLNSASGYAGLRRVLPALFLLTSLYSTAAVGAQEKPTPAASQAKPQNASFSQSGAGYNLTDSKLTATDYDESTINVGSSLVPDHKALRAILGTRAPADQADSSATVLRNIEPLIALLVVALFGIFAFNIVQKAQRHNASKSGESDSSQS